MAIRNHPAEWQFYILMDWEKRPPEETVRQRIELGHLKEQLLPLAEGVTAEKAAREYTALLQLLGNVRLTNSASMGAKLQNEKAFIHLFSEAIVSRLIF
jgi:hypothetical protein